MLAELGKRGYRLARRVAVAVIGGTTLVIGIVMIVTPGPAFLVIPLGLAILAVEFAWARVWLNRIRAKIGEENFDRILHRTRRRGRGAPGGPADKGAQPPPGSV